MPGGSTASDGSKQLGPRPLITAYGREIAARLTRPYRKASELISNPHSTLDEIHRRLRVSFLAYHKDSENEENFGVFWLQVQRTLQLPDVSRVEVATPMRRGPRHLG